MAAAPSAEPQASAAEDFPYTVEVEDIGPARKRLTITVPAATVSEQLQDSMGTLASETVIPGFRKGRAPRALVEKRFGSAVRDETKNQLIAEAFSKTLEEKKIKAVGEPEPDEAMRELKLEEGKPLTFTVEIEVLPEFELPSLDGIEIKKPTIEITDEHIENELNRQQQMLGRVIDVTDGQAQAGDRLVGHAIVRKEGKEPPETPDEPLFDFPDAAIVVPSDEENEGRGPVLGLLIDGLHEMLAGKKIGDSVTIEATGPESHENEDIRGAKLSIAFDIQHIQRIEPATAQEVIDRFGLGNEENLRQQVRLALEQRRNQEQAAAMREQVFQHLMKTVEFPLPEKVSANHVARQLERQRIEMLSRGVTPDEVETRLAEIRGDTEAEARNRLKLYFVLHRVAEQFNIEVTEGEVNGVVATIAHQRGERPAAIRADLERRNRLSEVVQHIREIKTADRLLATAKVTEISADEWNTLIAEQSGGRTPARRAPARQPVAAAAEKPARTGATTNKKTSKKK